MDRRAEKAARYEAFQQLALMAVDSGNPLAMEDMDGAVRLGEYKRGFDESEIARWIRGLPAGVSLSPVHGRARVLDSVC